MSKEELDRHLKAVLGWLWSSPYKDTKEIKNAQDILQHVIDDNLKELRKS